MTIVVPCVNRSTSAAGRAPSTAPTAATTDSSWPATVGTFAVVSSPSASSTASVNVPPTSTPRNAGAVSRGSGRR